ncbi:hypothetical protein FB451DRAFT_1215653 [Mycena latifolia]|nr:hypothetical protein FB451DRAFT_1215653 [Mycena latifolia]
MHISTSFLALALVSFVAALPADDTTIASLAKRSVHCETSGASPTTADAIAAAQFIQGLGTKQCCDLNGTGSECSTMHCIGTACVGICSAPGNCDNCLDAGNGLLDIANSCSSGGLSGGSADAPAGLQLILFHS